MFVTFLVSVYTFPISAIKFSRKTGTHKFKNIFFRLAKGNPEEDEELARATTTTAIVPAASIEMGTSEPPPPMQTQESGMTQESDMMPRYSGSDVMTGEKGNLFVLLSPLSGSILQNKNKEAHNLLTLLSFDFAV